MSRTRAQEVRRSQKKSFYIQQLSDFIMQIAYDEPAVLKVFLTRVELSSDGGICYIYFSAYGANSAEAREEAFNEACGRLILYKPSLRKALAQSMHSRYVPQLRFMFDEKREKEMRINDLLLKVGDELAEIDAKEEQQSSGESVESSSEPSSPSENLSEIDSQQDESADVVEGEAQGDDTETTSSDA